jgi:MFS family permease
LRGQPSARPISPALLLTVLSAGTCVSSLSQAMVIPLLPGIQRDLGLSPTAVTWTLTGYMLAAAVATPLLGRLADIHGKRTVLLAALGATIVGALLAGLWHSGTGLLAGRVLQGGVTAVYPMALSIVRDEVPRHRLRAGVGTLSALFGAGGSAGLIAAALVTQVSSDYRVAFLGLTALLVVCLLLVVAFVPESPVRTRAPLDLLGATLLAIWLAAALVAVTEGHGWGWLSPATIGAFAFSAAVAVVWWRVESRSASPLVHTGVLLQRGVLVSNVGQLLIGFTAFLAFVELSDFVQTPASAGYGFSASVLTTSIILLPWTVTSLIARPMTSWLLHRLRLNTVLVTGSMIIALAFVYLAMRHGTELDVYLAAGGAGLGIGMTSVVVPILVVEGAPQSQMGVATSINVICRNVGAAAGAAVAGALLAAAGTVAGGYPRVEGYVEGFLAAAGCCAALAVFILFRRRRGAGPAPHPSRTAPPAAPERTW